jgi:carnitine O-acetyltransferase
VYEPAMTKAFLHGRTEAIRSVQPESVEFTKVCVYVTYCATSADHLLDILLRRACRTKDRPPTQSMRATCPADEGV